MLGMPARVRTSVSGTMSIRHDIVSRYTATVFDVLP